MHWIVKGTSHDNGTLDMDRQCGCSNAHGKLLPRPVRVRIELDPPFKAGEKTMRVVDDGAARKDVALLQPRGN
jgi:hypothetical protein